MDSPIDPRIQVVYQPGGLTSTAHAVHVVITVLTCGAWLPIYLIIIAAAPLRRVQVLAGAGVTPQEVQTARLQALALTPQERRYVRTRILVTVGGILTPVLLLVLATVARQIGL